MSDIIILNPGDTSTIAISGDTIVVQPTTPEAITVLPVENNVVVTIQDGAQVTLNEQAPFQLVISSSSASSGSDSRFVFFQTTPSTLWHIVHNLGKHPSVVLLDGAGKLTEAYIEYIDDFSLNIHSTAPMSGVAYLN